MPASASSIEALHRAASALHASAAARFGARMDGLPALWLVTDPARTPDPLAAARRLPPGSGVIYRAFGAADARRTGRGLAAVCRARGLLLLAGADAGLAAAIGADGVHLPERLWRDIARLRRARPDWTVTTAAHSRLALTRAARAGAHAALLSPVFASDSPSAGAPLGVSAFARLARGAGVPVYALGGVSAANAGDLAATGAAGIAAVSALA